MKRCPFCGSNIPLTATECTFCGERLEGTGDLPGRQLETSSPQVLTLVMGILGFFCFPFGITAIVLWFSHRGKVKRGLARPDGSATAGMVVGTIGLCWQMLVFIGIIAMWSFICEGVAYGALGSIHKAQEEHMSINGSYAVELEQLERYDVQSPNELGSLFGYKFELTSDGESWSCVASPLEPGEENKLHYFYIDQTGKVRISDSEDIGPDSPEYVLPGQFGKPGSPKKGRQ